MDARNVVLELLGRLRGLDLRELFGGEHAVDGSIRAVLSSYGNINFLSTSLNNHFSVLESEGSWEVLIKDGYLALGVISIEFLSGIWVVNLYKEVKVRVPLFIVSNRDLYLVLSLFLAHHNNLVYMSVVFTRSS